MLALVRIQMCSLLILACRAVLLPGNYTARAGRQTDFQLTALKGERVFSNFFFPSISSKSEPARKLWREALVFICASQAEYDGQALSPGLGYPENLLGLSSSGHHWRLCEQHVGQGRTGVLTVCFWGNPARSGGHFHWSNRPLVKAGAGFQMLMWSHITGSITHWFLLTEELKHIPKMLG